MLLKASSLKGKAILEASLLQKLARILPHTATSKRGINTRLRPKSPYKLSSPCLLWSIQTDQHFDNPLKPHSPLTTARDRRALTRKIQAMLRAQTSPKSPWHTS